LKTLHRLELRPPFFTLDIIQFLMSFDAHLLFDLNKIFANNPKPLHHLKNHMETSKNFKETLLAFWILTENKVSLDSNQFATLFELPFMPLKTDDWDILFFKLHFIKDRLVNGHSIATEFIQQIQEKLKIPSADTFYHECQRLSAEIICAGYPAITSPLDIIGTILPSPLSINLGSLENDILSNRQMLFSDDSYHLINSFSTHGTASFLELSLGRDDQF
jgi:hypothetical protein